MSGVPPDSRLFLVRHGRVHNPERVAYGFLPRMRLDAEGREQARRAGRFLRACAPVALFASPLLRAQQTARLILAQFPGGDELDTTPLSPRWGRSSPIPVHRSRLLRESELARVWQGTRIDERPARFPEEWRLFNETPGRSTAGETLAAQAARLRRIIDQAVRRYPRGPLVFVSHRDPITALRLTVAGRSLDDLHTTRCEPGSITELMLHPRGLSFVAYHET